VSARPRFARARGTSRSGSANSTLRSRRPGRTSAGSSVSGRLVAMSTLMLPRGSKPSSWLISSSIVRCTSLSPPMPSSKRAPARNASVSRTHSAPRTPTADGVDLVEEDEAGLLGARHLEQLAHHARALAHVLLHQLGADDADEAGVGAVGDGARAQRLARAGRPVEQHALGRLDAQVDEALGLQSERRSGCAGATTRARSRAAAASPAPRAASRSAPCSRPRRRTSRRASLPPERNAPPGEGAARPRAVTCIIVTVGSIFGGRGRWIWYLFLSTLKVDFLLTLARRSKTRSFVRSPDTHALLDIRGGHLVSEVDHKLGELLHVDYVARLFSVARLLGRLVNDFGASSHLELRDIRAGCTRLVRTCSGCSCCMICLSAAKSHKAG